MSTPLYIFHFNAYVAMRKYAMSPAQRVPHMFVILYVQLYWNYGNYLYFVITDLGNSRLKQ